MFKQPVMPVVSLNGVSVKFAGQVSHLGAGFLNRGPRQPLGATERLSRGHGAVIQGPRAEVFC